MKPLHRILLLTALAVVALTSGAQTGNGLMLSPQTNEIIPPAPSSAQQIRYQSPQPSLATGAVSLSVPLYTLEAEGLSIPFTMSYQTSGIRPLDDPYPCGYGWSLQPALRVTRTIRGRADEDYPYMGDMPGDLQNDPSKGFSAMCAMPPGALSSNNNENRYDTEKDIFTISLPSGVYKRIVVKDVTDSHRLVFVGGGDDDEVVIKASLGLEEITATDARGYIYKFGSQYEVYHYPVDINTMQTTSWSLSSIVLPSGREISFTWTSFNHDNHAYIGGDMVRDSYNPVDAYLLNNGQGSYPGSGNADEGYYMNRLHLSEVSFADIRIKLDYTYKKISSFVVDNSYNDTIKSVEFAYGQSADANFLQTVTVSGEGTYSFSYNPVRFENDRMSQDWWGYYNGRGGNISLTPCLSVLQYENDLMTTGLFGTIGHADRRPDAEAMKAGILTKVTYPTGGSSEFEYGPHRFPPMRASSFGNISEETDPMLDMGGGLRIEKITTRTSGYDKSPIIRTYTYDSVVVRAVPSAATFVTISKGIGLYPMNYNTVSEPAMYTCRQIHVAHASDYMKNHVGEEIIWYPQVTEHHAEGAVEYHHSVTLPPDEEYREWGHSHACTMNNVLGKGVRLTRRRIFKDDGSNGLKPVLTEDYDYEKVTGSYRLSLSERQSYIINTQIQRQLVQSAIQSSEAPDFTDGRYLFVYTYYCDDKGYCSPVTHKIDMYYKDFFYGLNSPYRIESYTMHLQSDRLKSKTVTQHFDNGDFSQTETYTYRPGTSIITSVVTSTAGSSLCERIDISYADGSGSVSAAMASANAIGIPVRTTRTYGSAVEVLRRDMGQYGPRVFRPCREWLTRSQTEWLAGQYDYDSYGNIREYCGPDSVSCTYLWGYNACHPVYRIDATPFSAMALLGVPTSAVNGSAEKTDLSSLLAGRIFTRALWRPFVGISSLRQPSGMTATYTYDNAGRLIRTAIDGHGPVEGYSYHIGAGSNYTTHGPFIRESNKSHMQREITNYDGLGRETSQVTLAPDPDELEAIAFFKVPIKIDTTLVEVSKSKYIVALTRYDGMDRPVRRWAPVTVKDCHPAASVITAESVLQHLTDKAYTETFYEPSPRGLVSSVRKAGDDWHKADRRVVTRRMTNASSGDYLCHQYYRRGSRLKRRPYPAGTLLVEETVDEEGRSTIVFKDQRGLTVLTREERTGDWYDTPYIYNDYGDLLYVIQPKQAASDGDIDPSLCFRYSYDVRGRCISKALPECEPVTYHYDSRGRLFAEQDGNMRSEGRFLLHFYDRYGREVLKGFAQATESGISALCGTSFTACRSGYPAVNPMGGYVIDGGFSLTVSEIVSAEYYDSYGFADNLPPAWRYGAVPDGYATPVSDVTGLQAGRLDGDRLTVFHYDNRGKVVRKAYGPVAANPDDVTLYRYNYEGDVIQESNTSASADTTITRKTYRTYYISGHPRTVTVMQGDLSSEITCIYDSTGLVSRVEMGDNIKRLMTYDANGFLKSWTLRVPWLLPPIARGLEAERSVPVKYSLFEGETLHYADAGEGYTPLYDGRISARERNSSMMAYSYDTHGRLTAATAVEGTGTGYTSSYSYDRNANMLSFERRGITDVVSGYEYGVHNSVSMSYTDGGNRLSSIDVTREGADYERRTGLAPTDGQLGGFVYDANGNLICDPSRDIVLIRYNHLNLPVDIRFGNGQRQTIGYDGAGRKLSVEYSQTTHSVVLGALPDDDDYTVTSVRRYVGPHIFTDGVLEYSGFENGYFDPAQGVMYYAADWQGNNIGVYTAEGRRIRNITYYPYGEPTIEPVGERFLFGGKEREHGGGRNSYDFGARILSAGAWTTPDPLAEKFYPLSPYSYCGGDPINHIDRDGRFPLPIIMGIIGAGIDVVTQTSMNLIKGQSFTEAICKVDVTSVFASGISSAFLGPAASISRKSVVASIEIADAAVDIRINGSIRYVGGETESTNKSIVEAVIDLGSNIIPEQLIKHNSMSDLPVSSVVDNGTREWTKKELDDATKIVSKINAEGAKTAIEYRKTMEATRVTAPTDAIGSERRVPSINSDYYEKILRKDKESFE